MGGVLSSYKGRCRLHLSCEKKKPGCGKLENEEKIETSESEHSVEEKSDEDLHQGQDIAICPKHSNHSCKEHSQSQNKVSRDDSSKDDSQNKKNESGDHDCKKDSQSSCEETSCEDSQNENKESSEECSEKDSQNENKKSSDDCCKNNSQNENKKSSDSCCKGSSDNKNDTSECQGKELSLNLGQEICKDCVEIKWGCGGCISKNVINEYKSRLKNCYHCFRKLCPREEPEISHTCKLANYNMCCCLNQLPFKKNE